jgi:yecA family protein
MPIEAICEALETATELPQAALRAGVAQASALAPTIIALAKEAASGVYLMPAARKLLVFGLYVLSAARERSAYPALLELARLPEAEREAVFGIFASDMIAPMLVSLFDGDCESLLSIVESRELDGSMRTDALVVLARLVWEARVPRHRLLELLDRFDREKMAETEDTVWLGWEGAISLLGLREFASRVECGWKAGRLPHMKEGDHELWFEELQQAEEQFDNPERFAAYAAAPIDDVVDAARRWWPEGPADDEHSPSSDDPAADICLDAEEIFWLTGFLTSRHVPDSAMPLEMVDGYFSALIAGPEPARLDLPMAMLWGADGGAEPRYASSEQAALVAELLSRYWRTIQRRLEAPFPHEPFLEFTARDWRGRDWADGFLLGVSQHQESWAPLVRHKRAAGLLTRIMQLVGEEYDPDMPPITGQEREQILGDLPLLCVSIYGFWRQGGLPGLEPLRVEKIGRNDPCPCGSGKKYKKCCLPAIQ